MSLSEQMQRDLEPLPSDDVPVIAVIASRPRGTVWRLTCVERCPLGQRHFYGGGDGPEPSLGARFSHCTEGKTMVELVLAPAKDPS